MKTQLDTDTAKLNALCSFLDCAPEDLKLASYDHFGLPIYKLGSQEYAIGTDDEADKAARENMEQSVWAFNASFILSECNLPSELENGLKAWQEKECEGCNDELLCMVNRLAGDSFYENAIASDGRGHFLSGYDGDENEQGGFYIYRIS